MAARQNRGSNRSHERPVAAIDIGSNSIFLMIVAIENGRPGRVLERVKHRARLGAAIGPDGAFNAAAMDAAVAALRGFRAVIDRHDAQVQATATAAMRTATNGAALLARIEREAGISVALISGEREAALVYLGVQSGQVAHPKMLCADVGGGSTEVVVGHGHTLRFASSLPVGAVTLSHPHLLSAPVSDAMLRRAAHQVGEALASSAAFAAGEAHVHGWERAVATSGSAQRIARIVQARRGRSSRSGVDGMIVTRNDLASLRAELARASSHADRLAIPGMDPDRADVLLGGVLIFEALSDALKIAEWHVSMAGLRMGLVAEALRLRSAQE